MATAVANHRGELCRHDVGSSESDDDDDAFADELEAELFEAEANRDEGTPRGRKRKIDEDEGTPRGRASKAARPDDQSPGLATLPPELLNIVLQWLSPEDLTQVSETCRALRGPTMEDSLWRRCYCARFGHPKQREREREKRGESRSGGARGSGVGLGGGGGGPGRGSSWRAMYYLDDAREMRQATSETGDMRDLFRQMQRAKRSAPPDPTELHTDDVLISTPTDAEAVARYRASKGLGDGTDPASRHTCSLANGCSFHRVGADVFVCERTGRAHVCDEECRERVVDMDGMSEMCSISGRSFDRILDEGAEGMTGGGGFVAEGVGDPTGERGWLGKCFEAGYGASSEREMYAALWGGDGRGGADSDTSDSGEESD